MKTTRKPSKQSRHRQHHICQIRWFCGALLVLLHLAWYHDSVKCLPSRAHQSKLWWVFAHVTVFCLLFLGWNGTTQCFIPKTPCHIHCQIITQSHTRTRQLVEWWKLLHHSPLCGRIYFQLPPARVLIYCWRFLGCHWGGSWSHEPPTFSFGNAWFLLQLDEKASLNWHLRQGTAYFSEFAFPAFRRWRAKQNWPQALGKIASESFDASQTCSDLHRTFPRTCPFKSRSCRPSRWTHDHRENPKKNTHTHICPFAVSLLFPVEARENRMGVRKGGSCNSRFVLKLDVAISSEVQFQVRIPLQYQISWQRKRSWSTIAKTPFLKIPPFAIPKKSRRVRWAKLIWESPCLLKPSLDSLRSDIPEASCGRRLA